MLGSLKCSKGSMAPLAFSMVTTAVAVSQSSRSHFCRLFSMMDSTPEFVKVPFDFLREFELADWLLLSTLCILEVVRPPFSSSQYDLNESRLEHFTSLLYLHREFREPSLWLFVQVRFRSRLSDLLNFGSSSFHQEAVLSLLSRDLLSPRSP